MVLSTSTLNLKFMQRAAARNAQAQANGGPSAPATPQAAAAAPIASSSTPTPATRASEPTPQATPKYVSSAVEEAAGEEVWFMPNRPTRPARMDESSRKWTFEPSYVPFLAKAREGSQGGGGRMKFGFGEEEKKENEEEAEKDTEEGTDGNGVGEGALTTTRRVPSAKSTNRQPDRHFHRPKGFDNGEQPDEAPKPAKTGPSSTLDRLRGLAGSKKRKHEGEPKNEPSTNAVNPTAASKSAESVVAGSAKASTGLDRQSTDKASAERQGENVADKPKKKKKKSGKKHNKDRE